MAKRPSDPNLLGRLIVDITIGEVETKVSERKKQLTVGDGPVG
jgi:hypothetical protein